jgi:hypothetical protein
MQMTSSQRYKAVILLSAILAASQGCATVRVARPDNWTPDLSQGVAYVANNTAYSVSSPATRLESKTVWVCWWGLHQQNVDPTNSLNGNLAEVRVRTNLAFELISVLTLGFVQPVTVDWRCAKDPQSTVKDF